jgi:hypothetical protein
MKTKIIHNKEEFENNYYYDKKYLKEKNYPKHYPCILLQEHEDGGIGGSYVSHTIVYVDKKYDLKSFMAGFEAREKTC